MHRAACLLFFAAVWLSSVFGHAQAASVTFPALTGRVVDQAQILSPQTTAQLAAQLAAHEQATGQQVVVATVPSLQGLEIADYGYQLGRAWGIGEKGKNTGVILLVAPNDRQVRIEVGYGLEGTLTDAASRTIIEQVILPDFRAGHMEQGVVAGASALLQVLAGDKEIPAAAPAPQSDNEVGVHPLILIAVFLFLMFFRSRRRGLMGGLAMGAPILWRGGSSSGDSFGDSFRGGGGSFGGGGASGRW